MTDKHAMWKWLVLIVVVAVSLAVVTPPSKKIRKGLDLAGGTSFVVSVDKKELAIKIKEKDPSIADDKLGAAVEARSVEAIPRVMEVLRNRIDQLAINEPDIRSEGDKIVIQLPGINAEKQDQAEQVIQSTAYLTFRLVDKRNSERVKELFRDRLEPPGYVMSDMSFMYEYDTSYTNDRSTEAYKEALGRFGEAYDSKRYPEYEFMLIKSERDGHVHYRPVFVKRRSEMEGELLKEARVTYGSSMQPLVSITFTKEGRKDFARITEYYAKGGSMLGVGEDGRQLAIVLDGTCYSAPTLESRITSGEAQIRGITSPKEAMMIANVLSSGALSEPVKIDEIRSVSPSLGEDSIETGMKAIMFGGIAVVVFMLVYYMLCGVIADLALLLNIILLPLGMLVAAGFMSLDLTAGGVAGGIKLPVLTLPGIAGILLTIGMAVDANVLIFERIREEQKTGKRLWTAITAGYDRAFVTIMDANITTLLTGVILFRFGSGPIRGFAVTLCAGIIVSVFTALVVTKLFFGVLASSGKMKKLHMLAIVGETNVDFVGKRRVAAIVSVSLIVLSMGLALNKARVSPDSVLGVDFLGGSSLTYAYDQKQDVDAIRGALGDAGITQAHIQYMSAPIAKAKQSQGSGNKKGQSDTGGRLRITVRSTADDEAELTDKVNNVLTEKFPKAGFSAESEDAVPVGSPIGKELRADAFWSIGLALVGIVIYLSWRFEFGFALGAIVALVHDVLMTMGLYLMFGRQLSLPIVAALLTIVGYSVNDTIVVFDRIREDLKLVRGKSFPEISNLSINQTLSRTLLTSVTTLIAVLMLLVFGGGPINDFALALCIGVVVGTYSSVFVATPVVLVWYRNKKPAFAVSGN